MKDNRRNFLKKSTLLGLTGLASGLIGKEKINAIEDFAGSLSGDDSKKFMLPKLPYEFNALEPYIDARTMEIHYTKHHQGYTDKLNTVPADQINFNVTDSIKCRRIDANATPLLRNNLGGYFNHALFWPLMSPNPKGEARIPSGALAQAITSQFGSFDDFKKEFSDKAAKIFGSGWCWLILDSSGKLRITTTPNQDNPLMAVVAENGTPVLCLDVWEHAYYLKYQNKRTDYISNWWNVVNWEKANELFTAK